MLSAGGAQYPAFAPNPLFLFQTLQKWKLGFLVSLYLLVQNLPQPCMRTVICSPIQVFGFFFFFFFLLLEESCVQVQARQPCLRGPQVPACLPTSVAGIEKGLKRLPQPGAGGPGSRRAVGAPSRQRRNTALGQSAWKGDASGETRNRAS